MIVCYGFPPYPGIGGRRWAKFAKYLKLRGHEVYILGSKNPYNYISEWVKDIEGLNLPTVQLPSSYFKILFTAPKTIISKIKYRLAFNIVKFAGRGNYYDRALFWKKQVVRACSDAIKKHNVSNVIVAGAPFHLVHYCLELKSIYPEINLIFDFRDPWTQDTSISSYSSLNEKRKQYENKLEYESIDGADVVITVADEMTNYFKNLVDTIEGADRKFVTIRNGFDYPDFDSLRFKNNDKNELKKGIRFICAGTVYNSIENIFYPLVDALSYLKDNNLGDYNLFSFYFYGVVPENYRSYARNKKIDCMHFEGFVSLQEVYKQISRSDIGMLFITDSFKFSFSTKFYEYLSQHKKMAVFSISGAATAQYIEKNKIGYSIRPENIIECLYKILEDHNNGNLSKWESNIDISEFSVEHLAAQVENILI